MPTPRQVILFLIDGLRPDALQQVDTPAIDRLALGGARSYTARTVSPEISLPCHTSLFFSIPPQQHGIFDNQWQPLPVPLPGLFDVVKRARLSSIAVYSWEPLRNLGRPDALDFSYYHRHSDPSRDGRELELAAVAADTLVRDRPALTFLYIEVVDLIGHASGWMSAEYLDAVARADRAVELVLDELAAASMLEESVFVLTADHGGHDFGHGLFPDPADQIIPWIISGAGVRRDVDLQGEVNLMDTAPTIAHLLGLPIPEAWQGRVVSEALEPA